MDSREISIEQINKLDATAFRMLYKTYYKALVCYAIQITGGVWSCRGYCTGTVFYSLGKAIII